MCRPSHPAAAPLAAGRRHSVARRGDGTVVAVGHGSAGECDVRGWRDVVAVAAGSLHTLGLVRDGTVVAARDPADGRCAVQGWRNVRPVSPAEDPPTNRPGRGSPRTPR